MNWIDQARQYLARRRTAYVRTFMNPMGEEVLRDLASFCRAHTTTFSADARAHAVAEGRREVWLRVQAHLRLTDEELWRLYGQASQPVRTNTND
ncbi:MAG TPA: hypothetical protein VHQ87_01315 [Rhizobacter sp.]|nr:hypothetical protein [Rhizobacter sp.]